MNRCAGFSLVELVLVVVLTGILAAVASQMLGKSLQSFVFGKEAVKGDAQARVALERLTRDLRMVSSPANLVIAPATAITFSDTEGNNVSYSLAAGKLMRNTQVLADDVSSLQFIYLDNNTVVTSSAAAVYYITATVAVKRGILATDITTLRATVHPRNF
ncbi:MAG: prepilin-type N-terminal cleavage/methylation domain-containing protein [Gallionella sp.]|nr:prepilin-type N-terminal cleavage/methylation domain-containing protein [Gallionella sp.]